MGIFEATLKEELNKLLVQSSICKQYNLSNCHMPQPSCIDPNRPPSYKLRHLWHSSQILHSISWFPMYALSSHTDFSSFQLHLPPHKIEASTARLSPLQIPCSTRGRAGYPFSKIPLWDLPSTIGQMLHCYGCFCQMYFSTQKLLGVVDFKSSGQCWKILFWGFNFFASIDLCRVFLEINLLETLKPLPFLALLQSPRIGPSGRKERETKQPRSQAIGHPALTKLRTRQKIPKTSTLRDNLFSVHCKKTETSELETMLLLQVVWPGNVSSIVLKIGQ